MVRNRRKSTKNQWKWVNVLLQTCKFGEFGENTLQNGSKTGSLLGPLLFRTLKNSQKRVNLIYDKRPLMYMCAYLHHIGTYTEPSKTMILGVPGMVGNRCFRTSTYTFFGNGCHIWFWQHDFTLFCQVSVWKIVENQGRFSTSTPKNHEKSFHRTWSVFGPPKTIRHSH